MCACPSPTKLPPNASDEISGAAVDEEQYAAHLDALVDEALEETFPASDPPFWMPIGGFEPLVMNARC